ncbi:hypothetical protein BGW39_003408, partial [Mortierella sp. 14UC]
ETSAAGEAAPAPQKLARRLSFNFFNKKFKADKEKEKTAAATPAPVAEVTAEGEAEAEATPAAAADTEEAAPPTPGKDAAPVIEAIEIPAESVVEENAVATAH